MKYQPKRLLSLLMSLAMLVSLLSGLSLLPVQAATYVYNWGQRGTVATYLSSMAEEWYDENNTSYDELSTLSGSSSQSSVPSSALYRELQDLMESNHTYKTSYEGTKTLFKYTDCQNGGGKISSFYSGKEIGPDWDGTWNREHTWPNSKGDDSGQGENDIIMLRPTSTSENSSRGNDAYGESDDYYHPNSESNGKYDLRGDVARIMLFVYCRWGNTGMMWGKSGVIESMAVLLKWVEEDPVDTWELGRNDAAQSITGTRNVFVDYPELIFTLFGQDVPEEYVTPSGIGAGVSYTVTASSNNTSYGTVSVSGKTINATPKTGYMVSGYEIVGGDRNAIVTRDGNAFRVSASADVSIRINFAPRQQVSVQFSQQGEIVNTQTVYSGDSITLPAYTGSVPEGLTFVGWADTVVEETTEKPTCYTAGSSYMINSATTLYALYSRFEGEGAGNSDVYELVTNQEDLRIGDKVIIGAADKGVVMSTEQKSNNRGEQAVTVKDNSITLVDGVQVMTLEAGKTDNTYAFNVGDGYLYAASSSANYLRTETTLSNNSSWSISIASSGSATIKSTGSYSRNLLQYNKTASLFACYSSAQADIVLYKQQAGTVYYSTGAACDHVYAAATCTEPQTCTLCGMKTGVALGHDYDHNCDTDCNRCGAVRTTQHAYDNDCDKDCNVCGATRVPADHVYSNACDTTCNVCGAIREVGDHVYDNACDAACNECGATRVPADHVYDHTCDTDCNVCGTVRVPAAHVYTANCDATCDICGAERSASSGKTTVTFDADATQRVEFSTTSQVWQNDTLIVTNNKASATTNVANYTDPVRFYQNSQIIIAYPGMTSLIIDAPTGTYGTPWAATLGAAGLEYEVNNGVYTVTFATPVDSVTLTASAQIRANSITAVGGVMADHTYVSSITTAPTCVAEGVMTYTCSACGASYTEAIPATGNHTYANACDAACDVCGATREVGEHVYDDDFDVDCNECGAIREVHYNVFTFGGCSVSEDVDGLAFCYTAAVSGMKLNNYKGDYSNAVVSGDLHLMKMGAVVSNDANAALILDGLPTGRTIDIPAVYFFKVDANSATYAVRLIHIPENGKKMVVRSRPYYIYEDVDGNQFVCYGVESSASYNQKIG